MNSPRGRVAVLFVVFLFAAALTTPAHAATITVDHAGCNSLVDAIAAANGDTTVNGCGPGLGADTILLIQDEVFSAVDNTGANGPNGLPVITTDVTIRGQGGQRRIARDTAGPPPAFRLFEIGVGARLRLEDVTVENGSLVGAAGAAGPNGDENLEPGGPGVSGGSAEGGGIYSAGILELVDVLVKNNLAQGGRGGDGGTGLNGDGLAGAAAAGGGQARGGAVFCAQGEFRTTGSTFEGNEAIGGDGGVGGAGAPPFVTGNAGGSGGAGGAGGAAEAGAVYLAAGVEATIQRTLFDGESAAGGAGGAGGSSQAGTSGTGGHPDAGDSGSGGAGGTGGAASGGAIYSASPSARIMESAIRSTGVTGGAGAAGAGGSSAASGSGTGAAGEAGHGGAGGAGGSAIGCAWAGQGSIERSEIAGCGATGGDGGLGAGGGNGGSAGFACDPCDNGATGAGGHGGDGGLAAGALAADGGSLTVHNSTVSGNTLSGGNGGNGGNQGDSGILIGTGFSPSGDGGDGGAAQGAGVWSAPAATATIEHTTIAGNSVTGGTGGTAEDCIGPAFCGPDGVPGDAGLADGSGVHADASLFSTIIATNTGADQCAGSLTSLGANLAADASCNLTEIDDQPSETGAALLALLDNGGPALAGAAGAPRTHALDTGSTAIDEGDCGTPALTLDQRRFARDATCDVGAYEAAAAPIVETTPSLDLDIDLASQLEGDAGDTPRTLTLTLSEESEVEVSVDLGTAGTASEGSDYGAVSGLVSFLPGVVVRTVPFGVHGDTVPEFDETADFGLSNPVNATIADGGASLTIENDDTTTVTIPAASVVEGNAGSVQLIVTLQLSHPVPGGGSVDYLTSPVDATADVDYTPDSGTLPIPDGVTTVDLPFEVFGDLDPEFDERFLVTFSNPVNVVLSDGGGPVAQLAVTATITDDDQTEVTLVVTSTDPGSAFTQEECLPDGGADLAGAGGAADLTLREAICIANNTALPDVIVLADTNYTLTEVDNNWYGPNGLPPIADTMTIQGNGAVIERDGAGPNFRLFFVSRQKLTDALADGSLTLENLTLRGGFAKGGSSSRGGGGAGMGGAIFNQGTLVLDQVTIEGNEAQGGDSAVGGLGSGGGGIGQDATGGPGGGFGGAGPIGGGYGGGDGGAFSADDGGGGAGFGLAAGGDAPDSTFPDHGKGGDGGGGGTTGGRGGTSINANQEFRGLPGDGGGGGGAIFDEASGDGGDFGFGGQAGSGDQAAGGGGGIGGGGAHGRRTDLGFNVDHAPGGGGFGGGGGAELGNSSGDVNGGDGGFGGGGGYGVISGNGGFGGGNANSSPTVGGGGAGMGGAVFNHTGTLTCTNSTLSGNAAVGGSTDGASGGSGLGGAIFNLDGTVTLTHCTLAGNRVEGGEGGTSGTDGAFGGGAIYNRRQDPGLTGYGFTYPDASITVSSTILADSVDGSATPIADCAFSARTGGDALAQITSGGQNLVEGAGSCTFGGTGDLSADPQLGALGDNGGGKETHRPAVGSPAIDAAATCSLTVDERGVTRPTDGGAPSGAQCDIGAVEVGFSYSVSDVSAAEGSGGGTTNFVFQVTRIGDVDLPGSVSVSTDPVAPTTSGVDYSALSGFLVSFAANESSQPVTVLVGADGLFEPDDVFHLDLSGASAPGAIGDGQGVGTIQNDDIVSYQYYTVTPCRVVDTRTFSQGPALAAGVARDFAVTGMCGIPIDAVAVALNVTVVSPTAAGELAMSAGASTSLPVVSYGAGQTRASHVVLALAGDGTVRVLADQPSGTAHVILDVAGYFR